MAQARPASGFTLIELVIALAVVAITTLLAASSYRNYLRRGHRINAVHALLAAAVEQEKFHLANGFYGGRLDAAPGDDPPGLAVSSRTPGGHYALSVTLASGVQYRVVATATDAAADPACPSLSIDESGRRAATDARGNDATARCW
jgi:type IV pilus assembly protein PilE